MTFETALSDYGSSFRWRTMEGEVLRLEEMETSHIFNAMKMTFNHLAEVWNGVPIWYLHRYEGYNGIAKQNPRYLAIQTIFFIQEIERRGDLPEKYMEPYEQILAQLTRKLPVEEQRLLTP